MRDFHLLGRSQAVSKNGMVATSHSLASLVGIEILKKGGNAVDSAIAMALILPLCEPQSTGLFGDVFCILKQADSEKYVGLNGSGKSPLLIDSESLRSKNFNKIPETDICSITMPGAVKSFENLNAKFGKMDLMIYVNLQFSMPKKEYLFLKGLLLIGIFLYQV